MENRSAVENKAVLDAGVVTDGAGNATRTAGEEEMDLHASYYNKYLGITLICRSANEAMLDPCVELTPAKLTAIGILCYMRCSDRKKSTTIANETFLPLIVGELIARHLPEYFCLDEDEAKTGITSLIAYSNWKMPLPMTSGTIEMYNQDPVNIEHLIVKEDGGANAYANSIRALKWLCDTERLRVHCTTDITSIIVHCHVAFAKKGVIPDNYSRQLMSNTYASVTAAAIKQIYILYGTSVEDAETLIKELNAMIVDPWLSQTLRLHQSLVTGLTTYIIIGLVIRVCWNFPWSKTMIFIPDDWIGFKAALQTIGNNKYFGYSSAVQNVGYNRYKTLGWIAKELMLKLIGGPNVKHFYCTKNPRHKQIFEGMIHRYARTTITEGPGPHTAVVAMAEISKLVNDNADIFSL